MQIKPLAYALTAGLLLGAVLWMPPLYRAVSVVPASVNLSTAADISIPETPAQDLAAVIKWLSPKQPVATAADQEESDILSKFDHLFRGDAKIALVALVQKPEPVAIFWSRTGTQKGVFTKLKPGEDIEGLVLTKVATNKITLSAGEQHNELRLFKPVK